VDKYRLQNGVRFSLAHWEGGREGDYMVLEMSVVEKCTP
jgi:hypothetical protein